MRREALVEATIGEIGRTRSLDVTVSQIARRAGVSSALAHHYLGSKDRIFLTAMRHILAVYAAEVRAELGRADLYGVDGPRARVMAILRGSFAPSNFRPEVIGAWLLFYVSAQKAPEAARLLEIYKRRLRSNLLAGLRPLIGARADTAAEGLAALIDGLYIRQSLATGPADAAQATDLALDYLDRLLAEAPA